MKKSVTLILVWAILLPLLLSCNVYSPLSSVSSVEDYREEAISCLDKGDYACALTNYGKLPDGSEKSQDICTVTMGEAGMSLTALINVVNDKSTGGNLLGKLAQQLLGWNSTRGTAAQNAIQLCSNMPNDGTNASTNAMLAAVSLLLDCSTRMAKTDEYVSVADGDSCTTPGNNNGVLTPSDISVNSSGVIDSSHPGMCKTDITQCLSDISTLVGLQGQLQNAGLGDFASNVNQIPTDLTSTSTLTSDARSKLYGTVP